MLDPELEQFVLTVQDRSYATSSGACSWHVGVSKWLTKGETRRI
jgi:hypothetical protein